MIIRSYRAPDWHRPEKGFAWRARLSQTEAALLAQKGKEAKAKDGAKPTEAKNGNAQ